MSVDYIRYDILTQNALRGMVRTVLADAATNGLPGEHHVFIRFDTKAEGTRISSRLKAQYPDEMTIVLQHQFWDLAVGEEAFDVGLSFNGIPERLSVPFAAIKEFFDPSVGFQLAFDVVSNDESAVETEGEAAAPETANGPQALPVPANPAPQGAEPAAKEPAKKPAKPRPKDGDEGAAVVRLDQFRKKK